MRLGQPVAFDQGSSQIRQHFDIVVFGEFLQAVLVHLNGRNVLLLLDVNVSDVQPDVGHVRGGFAHLSEDVSRLVQISFVRQHTTDAVRRPNISIVVLQNRFVNLQRSSLMPFFLGETEKFDRSIDREDNDEFYSFFVLRWDVKRL